MQRLGRAPDSSGPAPGVPRASRDARVSDREQRRQRCRGQGRLEPGPAAEEAQLHQDAEDLSAGDRVLVVDDVLATGGTAEASLTLIRRAGADVAGLAVLMELGFLGGRARLEPALASAPLKALLTV